MSPPPRALGFRTCSSESRTTTTTWRARRRRGAMMRMHSHHHHHRHTHRLRTVRSVVVVVVGAASRKREKKKKKFRKGEANGSKTGGSGGGGGGGGGGAVEEETSAPRVNGELRLRRQLRSLKVLAAINEAADVSDGNEISALKRRQQQRHGIRSSFRRTQEYAERKREAQQDEERERVRDLYAPSNPLEEWMVQRSISLSPAGLYGGGDARGNRPSTSKSDGGDDDAEDRGRQMMSTLFIDGYNVVGACADLSSMRDASHLWEARDELHARTSAFCRRLGGGVAPIVVWDARSAPGRAAREQAHERHSLVRAVHTYDADMWIEARVASMCDNEDGEHASIWVATSDNLLAQSCFGMGAMIVSSRILLEEMAAAAAADAMTARAAAKAATVHTLSSGGGKASVNVAMDGMSPTNIDHSLGNGGAAEVLSALRTRILYRERSQNKRDLS